MPTGPAAYLSPGHRRRRPFLRTARLDLVGFGALGAACLVAGALTALALRATGWPLSVRAAVGPVIVVIALLVADRRKWSRMETSLSFTDDAARVRAVVDRLVARGLPVVVDEEVGRPRLRYRNRDAARVRAALADLGIRSD
jgi:hypothetical protein